MTLQELHEKVIKALAAGASPKTPVFAFDREASIEHVYGAGLELTHDVRFDAEALLRVVGPEIFAIRV